MTKSILAVFVVIVLALAAAHHSWRALEGCAPGTTPSSLTFGYTNLRPGSTRSCLSSDAYAGFGVSKLELPFTTTPANLLYWNGLKDSNFAPFAGKRVLLGQAYPAGVYAYDLDAKKVLWRHDFYANQPNLAPKVPLNSSAPVIDPIHHRLYGTFIEERFVGKKATDSRLTQHYYSIALDGSDFQEMPIDLSRFLLAKDTQATADEIAKYVRCRAALGINAQANPPYVFSGCSIVRAFSFLGTQFVHQASSQTVKGIRGLLLALPIDPVNGHLASAEQARAFVPSQVSADPDSGVDAGIWHSGGAPAVLPKNHLLFATGNGVYLPDQGVYGCATILLGGDSLAVEGSYFSAKGKEPVRASRLCHDANQDPSSSSPATLEIDGRFYSTLGGKDGWIKSFDPYALPGSRAKPEREEEVVKGFLFGQPVMFRDRLRHAIAAIGGNGAGGVEWAGYEIRADYSLRRLWTIRDPHPRAYNSSATGAYREEGDDELLLIPLASGEPRDGFPSALQAVEVRSGRVLGETALKGASHFSMPTVVDDRVFLPTAEHGIYEFVAKPQSFATYLKRIL